MNDKYFQIPILPINFSSPYLQSRFDHATGILEKYINKCKHYYTLQVGDDTEGTNLIQQQFSEFKKVYLEYVSLQAQLQRFELFFKTGDPFEKSNLRKEIILAYSYERSKVLPKWREEDFHDQLSVVYSQLNELDFMAKVLEFESTLDNAISKIEDTNQELHLK